MQSTEWRPVPGYEGYYEISAAGDVRSVERTVACSDGRMYHVEGRIKAIHRDAQTGYLRFNARRDGRSARVAIHRTLAEAFIPNPHGYRYVLHNDGDKNNNDLSNLRWGTQSDNMYDNVKHGGNAKANQTHCKHGHEFTEANTYTCKGKSRICKTCLARNRRRYNAPGYVPRSERAE